MQLYFEIPDYEIMISFGRHIIFAGGEHVFKNLKLTLSYIYGVLKLIIGNNGIQINLSKLFSIDGNFYRCFRYRSATLRNIVLICFLHQSANNKASNCCHNQYNPAHCTNAT